MTVCKQSIIQTVEKLYHEYELAGLTLRFHRTKQTHDLSFDGKREGVFSHISKPTHSRTMKFFRRKKQEKKEETWPEEGVAVILDRTIPDAQASESSAESETPYHRQEDEIERKPTPQTEDEVFTSKLPGWMPKMPDMTTMHQMKESVYKMEFPQDKKTMTYLLIALAVFVTILIFSLIASTDSGAKVIGNTLGNTPINWIGAPSEKSVAFIGNLNFILNDLPRVMEEISEGSVTQDSCLHQQGNLLNILKTGNGMYAKWSTNAALMDTNTSYGTVHDYGACSVPQLLLGQDADLTYRNQYGKYYDDGTNPCFNDQDYFYFQQLAAKNYASNPWEYVVMTDQAKRMSFDYSRANALLALNYTYAPIMSKMGATPIIVQPHAFWSDSANMTGLYDLPTFTSLIMEGAKDYKDLLDQQLSTKTKIAPVGNAFLVAYETNQDLYNNLFLAGGTHPSPMGTLLYALTIFGTIYGSMPRRSAVYLGDDMEALFANSRRVQYSDSSDFPTESQAKTLYKIARRVSIGGYKPSSLKGK